MPEPAYANETAAQTGQRDCKTGYACGETCITRTKVCLRKLASVRTKELTSRYVSLVKQGSNV